MPGIPTVVASFYMAKRLHLLRQRVLAAFGKGNIPTESAKVIVPVLMRWFKPERVLDVGCGDGAFLREFKSLGCECTTGIDCKPRMPEGSCHWYLRRDLSLSSKIKHFPSADLTLCLEVAEHLPKDYATILVGSLCDSAPVVIFSAAIPGQGGWGHINEQWQSYWASIFSQHGYSPCMRLRQVLWNKDAIAPWYRQNIMVYYNSAKIAYNGEYLWPYDIVHPEMWKNVGLMNLIKRVRI